MPQPEYQTEIYPVADTAELDRRMANRTTMGWRVRFISELRDPTAEDGSWSMSWAIMWERAKGAAW